MVFMKFDMTKNRTTMTGALLLASVIWGSGAVFMQVCIDGGIETGLQMFFRFWELWYIKNCARSIVDFFYAEPFAGLYCFFPFLF